MKKIPLLIVLLTGSCITIYARQDTTLQEFTGKYKFPDGSVVAEVVVTYESGLLSMESSAGNSDLVKQGNDSFNVVSFQGTALFRRNETKKIVGVVIDVMGYHLEGNKEDTAVTLAYKEKEGSKLNYFLLRR